MLSAATDLHPPMQEPAAAFPSLAIPHFFPFIPAPLPAAGSCSRALLSCLLAPPSPRVPTVPISKLDILQLAMQGGTCRDWILFPSSPKKRWGEEEGICGFGGGS